MKLPHSYTPDLLAGEAARPQPKPSRGHISTQAPPIGPLPPAPVITRHTECMVSVGGKVVGLPQPQVLGTLVLGGPLFDVESVLGDLAGHGCGDQEDPQPLRRP
jgi:hypothetical protein